MRRVFKRIFHFLIDGHDYRWSSKHPGKLRCTGCRHLRQPTPE